MSVQNLMEIHLIIFEVLSLNQRMLLWLKMAKNAHHLIKANLYRKVFSCYLNVFTELKNKETSTKV